MLALTALLVAQQQLPAPDVSPYYLTAWIAVAFIGGTPGVVAAVMSSRNRKETRQELQQVRHEVTPNGGSSSFDLLHRLAWETHESTGEIRRRVELLDDRLVPRTEVDARLVALDARLGAVEATPCPYQPSTPTSEEETNGTG
jgi:hypothetical protein